MQLERVDSVKLDKGLLGHQVKEMRKELNLKQEELAELCGCSPAHVSDIEQGKCGIKLELLLRFCILSKKPMDFFVMDNPSAMAMKIDGRIAPMLGQCNSKMLDFVTTILSSMLVCFDMKTDVEENSGKDE